MEGQPNPRTAPFYSIPPRRLVSVEHPAVIKDVDKAVDTLQGDWGIPKFLNPPRADAPARLMLRPEDPMSRPLHSTSSATNNILLKVTVPKRTGRKRKRGSDEPFSGPLPVAEPEPQRRDARELLKTLRDNVGRYQVEPVGMVQRTHVFRGIPDFVFSTTASSFTNRFRDQIFPFDLEKMKQFDIDMRKGATSNIDVLPPPSFGLSDVPFPYIYRQNPSVKHSTDPTGKTTTVNIHQATKVLTYLTKYDDPTPTGPRESCPPIPSLEKPIQETITILQGLFEKQPAWTRRAIRNYIKSPEHRTALRYAVPYVGYIFLSGPWRDAIIKFGHDPRSHPSYRLYQTFMFKILPREPELARDGGGGKRHNLPRQSLDTVPDTDENIPLDTHIFSGQPPLPRDGRIWMAKDLADPLLHSILFPPGPEENPDQPPPNFLRAQCEPIADGWYGNGAIAKVKAIMRNKIQTLIDDRVPDDAEFEKIVAFPNIANSEEEVARFFSFDPKTVSNRELVLATEVRSNIKASPNWKGVRKEKREGETDARKVAEEEEQEQESEGEGEEEEMERGDMEGAVGREENNGEDDE